MVISADSTIGLKLLTDGEEVYLTLDGQRGAHLEKNDEVEVRTSPLELKLVTSSEAQLFRPGQGKARLG